MSLGKSNGRGGRGSRSRGPANVALKMILKGPPGSTQHPDFIKISYPALGQGLFMKMHISWHGKKKKAGLRLKNIAGGILAEGSSKLQVASCPGSAEEFPVEIGCKREEGSEEERAREGRKENLLQHPGELHHPSTKRALAFGGLCALSRVLKHSSPEGGGSLKEAAGVMES